MFFTYSKASADNLLVVMKTPFFEVDGRFGEEGDEFKAVALVEADAVLGVVEDRGREFAGGFGHGGLGSVDQLGSLIT